MTGIHFLFCWNKDSVSFLNASHVLKLLLVFCCRLCSTIERQNYSRQYPETKPGIGRDGKERRDHDCRVILRHGQWTRNLLWRREGIANSQTSGWGIPFDRNYTTQLRIQLSLHYVWSLPVSGQLDESQRSDSNWWISLLQRDPLSRLGTLTKIFYKNSPPPSDSIWWG